MYFDTLRPGPQAVRRCALLGPKILCFSPLHPEMLHTPLVILSYLHLALLVQGYQPYHETPNDPQTRYAILYPAFIMRIIILKRLQFSEFPRPETLNIKH